MFQCEVLAYKEVGAVAVVFEAMKLREDQQSFHDHSLQLGFRESEVKIAREARAYFRSRQSRKDLHGRAAPIDRSIRPDSKHLQRQSTILLRHHHARDASRVWI